MRPARLVLLLVLCACSRTPDAPQYDVLIVNGSVFDGSIRPAERTNIGISGGRVISTQASRDATASVVIDAEGLMVVPGFIDPHTHASLQPQDADALAYANFLTQGVTSIVVGNDGRGIPDREATLASLAEAGIATNVAFFAGHGEIRQTVLGFEDRAPSAAELQAMQSLLEAEMRAGALGLSTGLYYAPGSFSRTGEVVALARTAARVGGIYETHLRDESSYTVGLIAAVEEAITIARSADVAVHISHIKALGRDTWGQSSDVIALIDDARQSGLNISANQYPWIASSVGLSSALIPRWVMAGAEGEMRSRLRDAQLLPQIRAEMQQNLVRRGGPQALLIVSPKSDYVGKTLQEVASLMETDAVNAAIELVIDEAPGVVSFVMQQDDIDMFAQQEWVMTGSDAGTGHPRKYATYPKVWRDFVVDRKLMSPARFVHRSSGQVADALGLCNRGYIRPGAFADIAIIDGTQFTPRADYENPAVLSAGVEHLLINGVVVIAQGELLMKRAGLILRHSTASCAE